MGRGGLRAAPSPELLFTNGPGGAGGANALLSAAGAATGVVLEGARPLLVEIQALVTPREMAGGGGGGAGGEEEGYGYGEDSEEGADSGDDEGYGGGGYGGGGGSGYGSRGPARRGPPVALPVSRNVTGFRNGPRVAMMLQLLGKHSAVNVSAEGWGRGVRPDSAATHQATSRMVWGGGDQPSTAQPVVVPMAHAMSKMRFYSSITPTTTPRPYPPTWPST